MNEKNELVCEDTQTDIEEYTKNKTNNISFSNGKFDFQSLSDIRMFSKVISNSALIPNSYRDKPNEIATAIAMGLEIGLNPFQSLRGIAVVNGTATLYGDAMMSTVKRSGLLEYEESKYEGEGDNLKCIFTVKRKNESKPVVREFSIKDASEANLANKSTWKQYPKRMLLSRARSHALRDCFPDVLSGMHSYEEIIEADPIIDVTPANNKVVKEKSNKNIDLTEVDNDDLFNNNNAN